MKFSAVYKITTFAIVLFFHFNLNAQTNVLGGWYVASLNYHFNKKFVLYTEVQARSQHVLNDFYYHELKAGIGYNIAGNYAALLGFGNYETYTFPGDFKKPVAVNEYRLWEQFVMNNTLSRVKFEQRYRIEQRWLNGNFFNRFRYRFQTTVPINHAIITKNTFFINAFDEVFFTDKPPYFLRNRVYGGAGFQFNKVLTLQTGFVRQFDYRTTDNGSGKNFMLTSLIFNVGYPNRTAHNANAD